MHSHIYIPAQQTDTNRHVASQAPKLLVPLMGDSALLVVVIKHFQAVLPSPNLLPVSLPAPQTQAPAG